MMKRKAFTLISALLLAVSALFVLTGSYLLLNSPEIPEELRKG